MFVKIVSASYFIYEKQKYKYFSRAWKQLDLVHLPELVLRYIYTVMCVYMCVYICSYILCSIMCIYILYTHMYNYAYLYFFRCVDIVIHIITILLSTGPIVLSISLLFSLPFSILPISLPSFFFSILETVSHYVSVTGLQFTL